MPALKVTVPVGVPPNAPETVAVKVTGSVTVEGFVDEVTTTLLAAGFTVCVSADEFSGGLFASPKYAAMIECVPTLSVDVVNEATPLAFSVPEPIVVAPSTKFTVPVATVLVPEVTVAVNVTGWL